MPTDATVSLRIPAQACLTPLVGAAAFEYSMVSGFPKSKAMHFRLAVEEVALHAITMGYGADDDAISITISRTSLGLTVIIQFKGLPLVEDSLPQFHLERSVKYGDVTGLSALLARKMVDDARFSVLDDGESEIVLQVNSSEADEALRNVPAPSARRNASRRIPTTYAIRHASPEDAEGISRLALRAHGSVLFSEQIYYPEHVRGMIESGRMISIVASATDGELIGHCAFVSEDTSAPVKEITFVFIDARYKAPGCSQRLGEYLLQYAAAQGMQAIRALAVTNHIHSQRATLGLGFHEFALLVGADPAANSWQKKPNAALERIANVCFVKYLDQTGNDLLYLPRKHKSMIERIDSNTGFDNRYAEVDGCNLPEHKAILESFFDKKQGWAIITVIKYGKDVSSQVEERLHLSLAEGAHVINLLLPLDCPAAPEASELFETLGFFFAGKGPGDDGRENLILQYLNDIDPGYDFIHLATPFARELLAYVRSCDPSHNHDVRNRPFEE